MHLPRWLCVQSEISTRVTSREGAVKKACQQDYFHNLYPCKISFTSSTPSHSSTRPLSTSLPSYHLHCVGRKQKFISCHDVHYFSNIQIQNLKTLPASLNTSEACTAWKCTGLNTMFLVRRASYVIGSLIKMCNQLCWYPRRCSYAIIQTITIHWIFLCSNGLLPQSVSSWNRIKVNEAEASSVLQYQLGQDPLPSPSGYTCPCFIHLLFDCYR